MAGDFLRHEACPKCGGGDPLARYSDGHGYCFSCGYYEAGRESGYLHHFTSDTVEPIVQPLNPLDWPRDAQNEIPVKALTWIKQYGIMDAELREHDVQWSDDRQMLLFPIRNRWGELIAWQGRSFGSYGSKWFTKGDVANLIHILGGGVSSTIVLVEDIVSAIKVSRHAPCMHLFGTKIRLETLQRLSSGPKPYRRLLIWLDEDAARKAALAALQAYQLGFERVSYLSTPRDPKANSDDEIKEKLGL